MLCTPLTRKDFDIVCSAIGRGVPKGNGEGRENQNFLTGNKILEVCFIGVSWEHRQTRLKKSEISQLEATDFSTEVGYQLFEGRGSVSSFGTSLAIDVHVGGDMR